MSAGASSLAMPLVPEHPGCRRPSRLDGNSILIEAYPGLRRETTCEGTKGISPTPDGTGATDGGVTSAAIEKPHRSGWRPLLECEFDLAYTPLMELDYGKGG